MKNKSVDIEKNLTSAQFAAKLRRLADAVEQQKRFVITIAGKRVTVPPFAQPSIEYEREGQTAEIEFQLKWQTEKKSPAGIR